MGAALARRRPLMESWQQIVTTLAAGGTAGAILKGWFDLRKRQVELRADGEQGYYAGLRDDIAGLKADMARTSERLHNAEQTILQLQRELGQKENECHRLGLDLERSNIERNEAIELAAKRAEEVLELQSKLAAEKGRNHALTTELARRNEEDRDRRLTTGGR